MKPRHCGLRRTVKSRGKTQQRIAKNRRYRSIASRNAKSQFAGRSTGPQFAGRNTPLQFAGRKSQLSQKYRKSQFAKSQSRRSQTQFLSFQDMGGEENLDLKYESRGFLYMKVAKAYETSEILLSTYPHASRTGYLLLQNPKVRPKHSFEDVRNRVRRRC